MNKIASEVALSDFERFCCNWGIDVPEQPDSIVNNTTPETQNEIIKASEYMAFIDIKERIIQGIQKGILVVSADGDSITHHCQYKPHSRAEDVQPYVLEYRIRSLGDLFDLDKADGNMSSTAAGLAALSGSGAAKISRIDPRDLKYASPVLKLFFSLLA